MSLLNYHLHALVNYCAPARRWRAIKREVAAWRRFSRRYRAYCRMVPAAERPDRKHLGPCLHDDTGQTYIEPIYFYQDNWAFQKIVTARPAQHVDIGSHHKFVALLSMVVPTTMVDIRPLSLEIPSLHFQEGTITGLPYADDSVISISSICVIEHIGLGRYGDPIDPDGSRKAASELGRVLSPGGRLYISAPVGPRTEVHFDADRTFTEPDLLAMFRPLEAVERRYIYGNAFVEDLRPGESGVGCYELRKPPPGA